MASLSRVRISGDGRWFTYYEDPDGVDIELKIGPTSSPAFKRTQRKMAKAHMDSHPSSRFGGTSLGDKEMQAMQIELALGLLEDWRGVEIEGKGGKMVEDPYSADRAREILSDPEFADMLEFIHQCGNNLSAHASATTNGTVKN